MRGIASCLIVSVLTLSSVLAVTGCGDAPAPVASAAQTETVVLGVKGMHCDGCATAIKTKVGKVAGVESCEVSLEGEQATIVGDPAAMADARAAIEKLGYEVTPASPARSGEQENR